MKPIAFICAAAGMAAGIAVACAAPCVEPKVRRMCKQCKKNIVRMCHC